MQFNNAFFDDLARSPGVTALVTAVAEDVARDAIADGPKETENYVNAIHVEVKHQRRTVALVVASDPKSLLIESKTGNLVRALNKAKRRHRG